MSAFEVRVPIAAGAPANASRQVQEWSRLFTPNALRDRLAIFRSVGLDIELLAGPYAGPVRESLALGTVAEVALRLVDFELRPDRLASVDALACLMRVTHGLVERRDLVESSLKAQLVDSTIRLLEQEHQWTETAALWHAGLAVYASKATGLWTLDDIREVGASQPLHLSVHAAAALSSEPPQWVLPLSADYALISWLAKDLLSISADHPSTRIVSPLSNILRISGRDAFADGVAVSCVGVLDESAQHMQLLLDAHRQDMPVEVREYAETTLRFAGLAYARCESRGLL